MGFYIAGGSYNPSYPLRSPAAKKNTSWLNSELNSIGDNDAYKVMTIDRILELLEKCEHDPVYGARLWNKETIRAALDICKQMRGNKAYLVVRRGRKLTQARRETQGILAGGEEALAPRDAVTLFLYRQDETPRGEAEVWWPQLRFADGNYVLAFSFDW